MDWFWWNESILLGFPVVQKRGSYNSDCKGKDNLSYGIAFFHKTSLLRLLQCSARCYAMCKVSYSTTWDTWRKSKAHKIVISLDSLSRLQSRWIYVQLDDLDLNLTTLQPWKKITEKRIVQLLTVLANDGESLLNHVPCISVWQWA